MYFKIIFHTLIIIKLIYFILYTFLFLILHIRHINIYNRILTKIRLKIRFNFNKLQHYKFPIRKLPRRCQKSQRQKKDSP